MKAGPNGSSECSIRPMATSRIAGDGSARSCAPPACVAEPPWRTFDEIVRDMVRDISGPGAGCSDFAGGRFPDRRGADSPPAASIQRPHGNGCRTRAFTSPGRRRIRIRRCRFPWRAMRGQPPASLVPRFWAPQWNSVQSVNKYQDAGGGTLARRACGQAPARIR